MKKGLTPSKELKERNELLAEAKKLQFQHNCKTLAELSKIYSDLTGKGRYYLRDSITRNGDTSEVMSYSSSSVAIISKQGFVQNIARTKAGDLLMRELTKSQAAIITAINGYVDENECQPNLMNLSEILGYNEFILALDLASMKEKGLVEWNTKDHKPALIWSTYER